MALEFGAQLCYVVVVEGKTTPHQRCDVGTSQQRCTIA